MPPLFFGGGEGHRERAVEAVAAISIGGVETAPPIELLWLSRCKNSGRARSSPVCSSLLVVASVGLFLKRFPTSVYLKNESFFSEEGKKRKIKVNEKSSEV